MAVEKTVCPNCEVEFDTSDVPKTNVRTVRGDQSPIESDDHDAWVCSECGAVLGVTFHG